MCLFPQRASYCSKTQNNQIYDFKHNIDPTTSSYQTKKLIQQLNNTTQTIPKSPIPQQKPTNEIPTTPSPYSHTHTCPTCDQLINCKSINDQHSPQSGTIRQDKNYYHSTCAASTSFSVSFISALPDEVIKQPKPPSISSLVDNFQKSNQTQKPQSQVKNNKPNPLNNLFPLTSTQEPQSNTDMEVNHSLSPSPVNQFFANNNSIQSSNLTQTNFSKNIIEDTTIESDHNIILLEFSILLTISSSYKQPPRKISLWKQVSFEQIQKYQTHIDQNLTKIRLHIPQIQNQ
ncbi:28809_t:CDS:2, partial [Dentiscutata erythropus]